MRKSKSRMAAAAVRSARCWWQWSFYADGTERFAQSTHCEVLWRWRSKHPRNHRLS